MFALFVCLVLPASAEDYKCGEDAGCNARINEDGTLEEVLFRKGDIVSTEDGWIVTQDDGWVKIKNRGIMNLHAGYVYMGGGVSRSTGPVLGIPHSPGSWCAPIGAPPLICLIR